MKLLFPSLSNSFSLSCNFFILVNAFLLLIRFVISCFSFSFARFVLWEVQPAQRGSKRRSEGSIQNLHKRAHFLKYKAKVKQKIMEQEQDYTATTLPSPSYLSFIRCSPFHFSFLNPMPVKSFLLGV